MLSATSLLTCGALGLPWTRQATQHFQDGAGELGAGLGISGANSSIETPQTMADQLILTKGALSVFPKAPHFPVTCRKTGLPK